MKRGVLVLLFLSCTTVANLKRPAWVRSTVQGWCGSTLALDAEQQVWFERGCENGTVVLGLRHRASDEAAQRVQRAFDALQNGVECSAPKGTRSRVEYRLLAEADGGSWSQCGTDGGEPFTTLDAAFDAL